MATYYVMYASTTFGENESYFNIALPTPPGMGSNVPMSVASGSILYQTMNQSIIQTMQIGSGNNYIFIPKQNPYDLSISEIGFNNPGTPIAYTVNEALFLQVPTTATQMIITVAYPQGNGFYNTTMLVNIAPGFVSTTGIDFITLLYYTGDILTATICEGYLPTTYTTAKYNTLELCPSAKYAGPAVSIYTAFDTPGNISVIRTTIAGAPSSYILPANTFNYPVTSESLPAFWPNVYKSGSKILTGPFTFIVNTSDTTGSCSYPNIISGNTPATVSTT